MSQKSHFKVSRFSAANFSYISLLRYTEKLMQRCEEQVAVMAVLLGQRAELQVQNDSMCNATREKVAELAKDRSRPLDQRRAEINRLIADTNQKLQQVDYSCEVLIPEIVGP
ncbi:MAG: hypothetical protein HYU02_06495 [Thaumarchaeota archaeon]|nr:hypothetical protein [Nitrososphaerota archaeon]